MSEIRSWDSQGGHISRFTVYPDIPMRIVAWPEGAPKQEYVPQAGELVRKRQTINQTIFEVANGLPYLYQDSRWYLRVYTEYPKRKKTIGLALNSLERIPPTPPQTYTEDEIREAVSAHNPYYTDGIINELRSNKS